MIVSLIILWLLIGFFTCHFSRMAWEVYWYRTTQKHFCDDRDYESFNRPDIILIYTLLGVISLILHHESFSPNSNYYFPDSMWMIFYNKEKVENKHKKKSVLKYVRSKRKTE